jgi:hypothetical protein
MKKIILILLSILVFSCEIIEPIPTYKISVSASPIYAGKITLSPSLSEYQEGSVVTLTPEPNEHWVFQKWEGDEIGSNNPLQVTVNSDKTIVGVFIKRDYPLKITINGEGTVGEKIIPNPFGREYPYGTKVELTPIPKNGWVFESWGGDLSGNESPTIISVDKEKSVIVNFRKLEYPISMLDNYSQINKKSSWYRTNISFNELLNVQGTTFRGFEVVNGNLIPFQNGSQNKDSYWHDYGGYLYTDLNGDGKKDLWATYYKSPWPTNARGLNLFVDDYSSGKYDIQYGLNAVRKQVLSNFNNDSYQEVMLFSTGHDASPNPGDSLAYFDVKSKSYKYLSDDIGMFHGGATGDVNLDGFEDIVAYAGSGLNPVHPVFYKNKGNGDFLLSNGIYKNFTDMDNYYTVELFDIDGDGWLDLFLGGGKVLLVIKNQGGVFDRNQGINIQTDGGVLDIDFFDFDKDGTNEILIMNEKSYKEYSLKLYKFDFNNHTDITSTYFEDTEGLGWIKWVYIFDFNKDGNLDIVGDGRFGEAEKHPRIYWKNVGQKFIRSYF